MGIHDWSVTPGTNAAADGLINWAEGQLPSTVNNSARQLMARVAEYIKDISPIRTSTGASNAYAIAIESPITSYKNGLKVCFIAHAANSGSSTLDVNGVGAKPLRRVSGVNLAGAALNASRAYTANYIAGTDEFLLEGSDLDGNALNSPAFTGTPTAPTASAGNSTTQLATTAFVSNAVNTLSTATTNALALKAPLASPALTGTPTAPTQSAGNNSTRIATTAFVTAAVAAAIPAKLSTASGSAPSYSARAFVTFHGGNGTILSDGNVSSVTDVGTGQFRVNFQTAAPNANFVCAATVRAGNPVFAMISDKSASNCLIYSINSSSGVVFDAVSIDAAFFW